MISINTVNKVLMTLTIFIFTFIFQVFIDRSNAMYIPIIYYMYIAPVLLLFYLRDFKKEELYIYLFIISLLFQYISNPITFRISTVLYTILFVLTFLLYTKLADKAPFSIKYYKKILLIILYSYSIVLFVQQVSYAVGVKGFNYDPNGILKFNILAQEASFISHIVPIVFYSYIKIRELEWNSSFKWHFIYRDKLVWFLFTYISLTCGSTTNIIGYLVVLMLFIKLSLKVVMPSVIVAAISFGIFFVLFKNVIAFQRITNLIEPVLNFDYVGVFNVDPSASARISPYMIYIQEFDLFNLHTWIGQGIDYSNTVVTSKVVSYESKDQGVGGMINFLIDYGLITFAFYIAMLRKYTFKHFRSSLFFFWLIIYSIGAINIYISWIYPIFIYTNNVIYAKYKKGVVFKSSHNKQYRRRITKHYQFNNTTFF